MSKASKKKNKKILIIDVIHSLLDGGYLYKSIFDDYLDKIHETSFLDKNAGGLVDNLVGTVVFSAVSTFANISAYKKGPEQLINEERRKQLHWYAAGLLLIELPKAWPYFRDLLSGLKNGNHAYRTSITVASALGRTTLHCLNPIGITLGGLLAINLVWNRYMNKKRDEAILKNRKLAKLISKTSNLKNTELRKEANALKKPTTLKRGLCYISTFFDGITDGVYLAGCVMTVFLVFHISILSFGAPLIVVTSLLIVWTVMSIIAKLMEEYEKQCALDESIDLVKNSTNKNSGTLLAPNSALSNLKVEKPWLSKGFRAFRSVVSWIKNARSFVVLIVSLVIHKPLTAIAKKLGVLVAGLIVGISYVSLMIYNKWLKKKQSEQNRGLKTGSKLESDTSLTKEALPARPLPTKFESKRRATINSTPEETGIQTAQVSPALETEPSQPTTRKDRIKVSQNRHSLLSSPSGTGETTIQRSQTTKRSTSQPTFSSAPA